VGRDIRIKLTLEKIQFRPPFWKLV